MALLGDFNPQPRFKLLLALETYPPLVKKQKKQQEKHTQLRIDFMGEPSVQTEDFEEQLKTIKIVRSIYSGE